MTTPKRPDQLDSPLLPVIFRYATRAQVWIYRRTGRLWPRLVEAYADFDTYQSRTDREIPVSILAPR